MKVCLASADLWWDPDLGGYAWVYLSWALGFQANGAGIILLEATRDGESSRQTAQRLTALRARLQDLGLDAALAVVGPELGVDPPQPVRESLGAHFVPLEVVFDEAALLVNYYYALDPALVARFARTALIDIDPGLLQVWMSEGQLRVAPHDVYFTTGETVGQPGAAFPDCGLRWHYVPPVVYLPAWPQTSADAAAPYTTVTNWWYAWERYGAEVFNNDKRTAFLEYVDLPQRAPVALELALNMGPDADASEWRRLERHGWRARRSADVCASVQQYRSYIQQSRGEFSCAKPSCMRLQNAWISDRTLCYLASGKPAVVQHTGPSRFLPSSRGLFRFRDRAEAVHAFETIEADYAHQSLAARALAEQHFDATAVAGRVLTRALAVPARRGKAAP